MEQTSIDKLISIKNEINEINQKFFFGKKLTQKTKLTQDYKVELSPEHVFEINDRMKVLQNLLIRVVEELNYNK